MRQNFKDLQIYSKVSEHGKWTKRVDEVEREKT
jgi:hypothetical protein